MDVHERIETDDDDDEEEEDSTDILLCATFVWDLMEEMIALGCHSFLGGRTTDDDDDDCYRCNRRGLAFDDYSYAPFASLAI